MSQRYPDIGAKSIHRDMRVRNNASHPVEMMDHACMAGVANFDTCLLQAIRIGTAFVPEWVEFGSVHVRRRLAGKICGMQR
jgi:hypothetical protein